ncbi:hypothetical protein KIPE111705_44135 [Kibdelosporangium persicum]|uniref:hypothetical protein n=1 Tax=Kibdelosporangium persicum TaxID=2698649 RepID=UPI001564AC51|nr:hypothetical protein [Kibdelosporangium persicum]
MSDTAKSSEDQQHVPYGTEISERTSRAVAAQAPRLFAVVIEPDDGSDPEVISWGMSFSEEAHMVSANGRNYYALADADNALNYVRGTPDHTPKLVWVAPAGVSSSV